MKVCQGHGGACEGVVSQYRLTGHGTTNFVNYCRAAVAADAENGYSAALTEQENAS